MANAGTLLSDLDGKAPIAGDGDLVKMIYQDMNSGSPSMPPMGGMGMGVDRLLMALTGLGIRETILFPLVKPTAGDE